VGDLRVRDDIEDLTISVGPHHWHVSLSRFDQEPQEQQVIRAADEAFDDVRAVLADETIIRLRRTDGRIASTMSYGLDYDHRWPLRSDETEYLWSGRITGTARGAVSRALLQSKALMYAV